MPSLITCFGRTQARMNWFVSLVSSSGDHGCGVLHGFCGWLVWVVGHDVRSIKVWTAKVGEKCVLRVPSRKSANRQRFDRCNRGWVLVKPMLV